MKTRNKIHIFIFLLSHFLFANSLYPQAEIRNTDEKAELQFKILESEEAVGRYISGDLNSQGFKDYSDANIPSSFPSQNRMLTLRTEFVILPEARQNELVLVAPPIFYACNIYLNGKLIARRGDVKQGYTSRNHETISIFLSPDLLYTDSKKNELAIELLPKYGEHNSAKGFFISNRKSGETYVFWRNLFSVNFIRAMALVSFVIFLYFFIFSFKRKKQNTSYYIPFSLACLTYPLALINNIVTHNFSDTLLLEKLSRFGLLVWTYLSFFCILEFTQITKYKNHIQIGLGIVLIPFIILGWIPDTVPGVIEFSIKYSSPLILIILLASILICLIFAYLKRTKDSYILALIYLLAIPCIAFDLTYFAILQTKPFAFTLPYLMFLDIVIFFFIVAWQQSGIYKLTLKQSEELIHINENLEQIVKQRTEKLQENEIQYRLLFENLINAFVLGKVITDESGEPIDFEIIQLNKKFAGMIGKEQDELIGKKFSDAILITNKEMTIKFCRVGLSRISFNGEYYSVTFKKYFRANVYSPEYKYIAIILEDITDLKEREVALNENERMFKNLIWNMQVGVLLQGPRGEILMTNPKAMEFLGLTEDQLLGKTSFDPDGTIIHEDGSPFNETEQPVPRAIMTCQPVRGVIMGIYHPINNDRAWLLVDAEPLLNEDGTIKQVVCTFIDITKQKQAETEIKKLSIAVEQNPSSIVITDTKGNIEYVNPKFTEVTGYTYEESIGQSPNILKSRKTDEAVYKNLWETITAGKTWRGEFINIKKDGEEFIENTVIAPIFSSNQTIINYIAIKEDITAKKEAETALIESEEKYRSLINGLGEMIFRISLPYLKYQYVSPSVTEIYGYTQEEFIQNPTLMMSLIHPDYLQYFYKKWVDLSNSNTTSNYEYKIIDRNGNEKWIQQSNKPIFNEEGRITALDGLCRDITKQKTAEIKILEQQKELEKSNRELAEEKKLAEESRIEIEKLNEFTKIINSRLDIAIILKEIYSYLKGRTGFDIVWIMLINKKSNRVFSAENLSLFNSNFDFDKDYFINFKMKLDDSLGVTFQTYQSRVPFYCPNVLQSRRIVRNHYTNAEYKIKKTDVEIQMKGVFMSMLQFPLILQNEVIGFLNLTSHKKVIEMKNQDIQKIIRFTDQVAGVIYNAHLLAEAEDAKREAEMEQKISQLAQMEMIKEKEKSEKLLLNILPEEIAEELKEKGSTKPVYYESVSVMFTDFKGFTKIVENLTPTELINELDSCFSYFDSLMDQYNLEKLKTIGDSYMCAGGIPVPNKTNPVDIVLAAMEIQSIMLQVKSLKQDLDVPYWELRLGIHTGPLVAGVIGEKKFAYDVWGDTVNIASRMESSGTPGMVNISSATYELVKDFFDCEYRGKVQAKNKGDIEMFYVKGFKKELSINNEGKGPSPEFWKLYNELKNQ